MLQRLRKHDFRAAARKLHLFYSSLEFLGFKVSADKVSISPEIAKGILNLQRPRTKRQLRDFIGLCSSMRSHIDRFRDRIEPFQRLLMKDSKFKLDQSLDSLFEQI